ncbi:MAG: VanZ family protein [Ruminococcaceae bacterium]|nr:VanZ family protein [Oscillospiraceae bacterium]
MKKTNSKKQIWLIILLTAYLLILFRLTVFRSASYPTEMSVNLSLFTDLVATYHENGIWMVIYLVVGNIVWFVPFGFMLPAIWQKLKSYHIIPLGFLLSLIIETGQLALSKGMFEIDDLVLNTLGTAIGCLIYKIYRDFRK